MLKNECNEGRNGSSKRRMDARGREGVVKYVMLSEGVSSNQWYTLVHTGAPVCPHEQEVFLL